MNAYEYMNIKNKTFECIIFIVENLRNFTWIGKNEFLTTWCDKLIESLNK